MGQHECILLIIILIAGTFGGIVSYYGISGNGTGTSKKKPDSPDPATGEEAPAKPADELPTQPVDKSLRAPILRGIAAAFIVPLFLNSVSSDLLKNNDPKDHSTAHSTATTNQTGPPDTSTTHTTRHDTVITHADSGHPPSSDTSIHVSQRSSVPTDTVIIAAPSGNVLASGFLQYLLFGATCLLASISSRAFIDSVSKRVLNLAQEAERKASNAERKATTAENTSAQTRATMEADIPMILTAANAGTPVGGNKSMIAPSSPAFRTLAKAASSTSSYNALYNSDPNKNRFGAISSRDGWTLSAEVHSFGMGNLFYKIILRVTVDDPAKIKDSQIKFHLHPTFSPMVQDVPIIGTIAELELIATGAFTVGVEINEGETNLELDLAELRDAPKEFRER